MVEAIRTQRLGRINSIAASEASMDGCIKSQRELGEISGLRIALVMPESLIQDYEIDLEALEAEGDDNVGSKPATE